MKGLAVAASQLYGQPMFKVLAKVNELESQGKNILHFEIGEPHFPSPETVVGAACAALRAGKTHYVNSMGILELRDAIRNYIVKEKGFRPTREQVLVTPANAVIYLLIRCVVDPGGVVIMPDPGFPTYYAAAKFAGAVPLGIPLREANCFRMSPEDIKDSLTTNTKLIIINSPHNPTGSVMTEKEIYDVANIALLNDVYLLTDETYDKVVYDARHYSPAYKDECRERTILLNSFSKAYSMTGWRLGYAVGPEDVIAKMGLLLQTIISCVPPFIQYAGIPALADEQYNRRMVGLLQQRRDEIVCGLNSLPGVSCLKPEGAFYAFPNIAGTGLSSDEFTNLMLDEAGVALLPGTNFGEYGEGYVRLSYATSKEVIEEAIERMRGVL